MIPPRPRLQALREQLLRQDHHGPNNGNNKNVPQSFGGRQKSDCQTTTARTTENRPGVPDDVVVDRVRASRSEESRPLAEALSAQRLVDPNESENVNQSVLTDRFGRRHSYLRLSLTERCNLRCTYCMPEQGLPELPPYLLTSDQLLTIASYFANRGVTKFRLTGGEPTLRPDLLEIVTGLRNLSTTSTIGMTTNGVALNERKLLALQNAGLTHINISLDTLHAEQFAKITRRPYFAKVMQTIAAAVHHTNLSVKINCVVQRNVNVDQVVPMIQLLHQFPSLSIRFIEYMPFADNAWSYDQCVPYTELLENYIALDNSIHLQPIHSNDPHDTTKWYQETITGGKIGFISSMSSHFCGSCNRLRITADGLLKVCLFDTEQRTVNLRQALLDHIPLDEVVGPAIQRKHYSLGGHPNPISLGQNAGENRPMTRIGG
jgi:molybdenum cofactor biosynthesis protein A